MLAYMCVAYYNSNMPLCAHLSSFSQIIKFPWQNHRHQVPQQNTAMNLRPNYHAPPPNSAAGMDPRNDPHCFPAEAEARVTHTQGQTQAGDGRPHHHCQMNGYMGYVEQERTGTVVSVIIIKPTFTSHHVTMPT